MKSLENKVNKIAVKFDEGQEIFRRSSVSILLARIQSLEIAAKQSEKLGIKRCTVCGLIGDFHDIEKHNLTSATN